VNQEQRDGAALAQNFAHAMCLFVYAIRLNKRGGMAECCAARHRRAFCPLTGDVWSHLPTRSASACQWSLVDSINERNSQPG
jgi:hypothetical protein